MYKYVSVTNKTQDYTGQTQNLIDLTGQVRTLGERRTVDRGGGKVGREKVGWRTKSVFLENWLRMASVGQGALLEPDQGREGRSERTARTQDRGRVEDGDGERKEGEEEKREK